MRRRRRTEPPRQCMATAACSTPSSGGIQLGSRLRSRGEVRNHGRQQRVEIVWRRASERSRRASGRGSARQRVQAVGGRHVGDLGQIEIGLQRRIRVTGSWSRAQGSRAGSPTAARSRCACQTFRSRRSAPADWRFCRRRRRETDGRVRLSTSAGRYRRIPRRRRGRHPRAKRSGQAPRQDGGQIGTCRRRDRRPAAAAAAGWWCGRRDRPARSR